MKNETRFFFSPQEMQAITIRERERILKIKAQMEVEIHALEEQIYREKLAQIARGNRPQMLTDGLR